MAVCGGSGDGRGGVEEPAYSDLDHLGTNERDADHDESGRAQAQYAQDEEFELFLNVVANHSADVLVQHLQRVAVLRRRGLFCFGCLVRHSGVVVILIDELTLLPLAFLYEPVLNLVHELEHENERERKEN